MTPEDIIVPEQVSYHEREFTVTEVGTRAFSHCTSLTSIKLPSSIILIDSLAFYFCDNITSIELPKRLKKIGFRAFQDCNQLLSINVPDSVVTIGDEAFYPCPRLNSISLPASLQSIGASAITDLNLICFRGKKPPTITNGEILYLSNEPSIFVPSESMSLYQDITFLSAACIKPLKPIANFAESIELTPSMLVLPTGMETTQSIGSIIATQSGEKYDGEYNWHLKGVWHDIKKKEINQTNIDLTFTPTLFTSEVIATVFSYDYTFITASCTIIPLKIQLPSTIFLQPGDKHLIDAKIYPEEYADNYFIKFNSESPDVAEINERNGEINVKSIGKAKVNAEAYDPTGRLITKNNTELYSFKEVRPLYDSIAVKYGGITTSHAMVELTGLNIGWGATTINSKDTNISTCFTVDNATLFWGYNIGKTTINYNFKTDAGRNYQFTCPLQVVEDINNYNITSETGSDLIISGSNQILTAKLENGYQIPVYWYSRDESIATIDEHTGRLTAKNVGFCSVECYNMFNSAFSNINYYHFLVLDRDNALYIDKSNVSLRIGEKEQLIAETIYYIQDRIIWMSSDETIATVDATGEVTAIGEGLCEIVATIDGTDISAKCTVEVRKSSGIIDADDNSINVETVSNQIIITGVPDSLPVTVFTTTGTCISSTLGNSTVNVATGIYIVRIGNRTVKVAVR